MSINVNDKNLGHATAYAYYKAGGGTMTEAEFTEFMADFGTASQTAVEAAQAALASKNAAQTAATTATNKASEATTAATTATTKAGEASTSASTATSAKDTAVSASQAATSKASEATTAAATATSAKTDAVAANTAAQSAKTAAQTAQTGAETAAASVSASAAQIQTNADDISELKEDFATMESDGVVPSAEQIVSDKSVTDRVPYHYRQTGGDGADREYVDAVVGGTVCWNQMFRLQPKAESSGIESIITDDGMRIVGTSTGSVWLQMNYTDYPINEHVYFVDKGSDSNLFSLTNDGLGIATTFQKRYAVGKATGSDKRLYIFMTSGVTIDEVIKPMFIDLTQAFGSTIADHIYSLEQSTAGAGVAFFKSLFPNDYYEYNSGELVSVSGLSAHVMRDVDNNIIRSYPLDSTLTLRGLFKLNANNNLYADGDTYDADGTVTRKYGVVDSSTAVKNVITVNDNPAWLISYDAKKTASDVYGNCISNYLVGGTYNELYDGKKGIICFNSQGRIYATIDGVTDSASLIAWLDAHPDFEAVYELAEPTTEEAEPYQHIQQCDPYGTEEFVSTGIVPVGHETRYPENLRAKIDGLPWNFASLIAPTESTFTATRNYVTGDLFIVSNVLYKATSNIANGGTITPNTNCTATTLAEIISALA